MAVLPVRSSVRTGGRGGFGQVSEESRGWEARLRYATHQTPPSPSPSSPPERHPGTPASAPPRARMTDATAAGGGAGGRREDRVRGDDSYEELLDSYFVDRLRFLNVKDRRAERLMRQFKEEAEQEGRASDHHALAVVCVDGSPEGDAALDFALDHLQRARSLVLVHGIHVPLTSSSRPGPLFGEDERTDQEHRALERRYLQRCHDANRHCMIKHFTFTTKGGFGHAVCALADRKDAASVVIGQRHPRPLMGASSTAVMRYCGRRPIVLVPRWPTKDETDD